MRISLRSTQASATPLRIYRLGSNGILLLQTAGDSINWGLRSFNLGMLRFAIHWNRGNRQSGFDAAKRTGTSGDAAL